MAKYNAYLFATAACVVVSIHLFTLKMISVSKSVREQSLFLGVTLFAMVLSRWLIFKAMSLVSNPTVVHLILNVSVFFTFALTMIFLKVDAFDLLRFVFGMVLVVVGLWLVQSSYAVQQ